MAASRLTIFVEHLCRACDKCVRSSQPQPPFRGLVHCGCPAGTHWCDLVSWVRLDQSANSVRVAVLCCGAVVRSSQRRAKGQLSRVHRHTPPPIYGVVWSADLGWFRTSLLAACVAHRVLADGLDHVLFGRPTGIRHQCRDLQAGILCRTRFRHVSVRVQLNEDAVHLDNVLIKLKALLLLTRSCP